MEKSFTDKLSTKLYFGPMSKNIVDSIIDFSNIYNYPIGLIASRRQIDIDGGYVNNWTTIDFTNYVRERTSNILLCRDHGGPGQGNTLDDGIDSILNDVQVMDIVHIDPWKKYQFKDALEYTIKIIEEGYKINKNCLYEVGTEQAIYNMNPFVFETFIKALHKRLPDKFHNIVYGVIQSGTSLEAGNNTGNYSKENLTDMINTCRSFSIMSKEHNGDYLTASLIKQKFNLGLSAINIAPELANLETKQILKKIINIDKWFDLVIADGRWKKWFNSDFNPQNNKTKVLELCGHYVFSHPEFNFNLDSISNDLKNEIFSFIQEHIWTDQKQFL